MKTIYLHIGTHKTGTTFLQRVLFANRDKLLKGGLLYPKSATQSELLCGHHLLPWTINPPDSYPGGNSSPTEIWGQFHKEVNENTAHSIIVSSEELCYLNAQQICQLRELLSSYRIVIVVYLRRQDQFLESLYAEQTKKGSYKKPAEIMSEQRERFDYYQLLNNWGDVFKKKNLIVRLYEKTQLQKGLLADFLGILDINIDRAALELSQARFNASINPRTLKIIRLLNHMFIYRMNFSPGTCRNLYTERLQYPRAQKLIEKIPRFLVDDDILSPETARRILAKFELDNAQIAREYLGRHDGKLFYESPEVSAISNGVRSSVTGTPPT